MPRKRKIRSPARGSNISQTARATRSLSQYASRSDKYSANPLISTVLDDTTPIQRPRGLLSSPTVSSRATQRTKTPYNKRFQSLLVSPQLTERSLACARRSIRREVIFALRKQGKGAQSPKRRRTTQSERKCK